MDFQQEYNILQRMAEVLITGMSGFAGRYLGQAARERGFDVVGTTRTEGPTLAGIKTLTCDLTQPFEVNYVFKNTNPDVIFHLGNRTTGRHEDSTRSFLNNIVTTALLIEMCRLHKFRGRIVFASSVSIYGTAENNQPIKEDKTPNPNNSYGLGKLYQEMMLRASQVNLGYELVLARGSNYCGPDQTGNFLPPEIANQVVKIEQGLRDYVEIWNGIAEVDLVDIRDVTKAYLLFAEEGGGIYHLSSAKAITVEEVARSMLVHSTVNRNVAVVSSKPREAKYARFDNSKLKQLGWEPTITLHESFRELLEWTRNLNL